MIQLKGSGILINIIFSVFIVLSSCKNLKTADGRFTSGYWYVKAKMKNNHKGNFIFETGAEGLLLDSIFAIQMFYNPIYYNKIMFGSGNKSEQIKLVIDTIYFKINNSKYISNNTLIYNFKDIVGENFDGYIGINYFDNFIVNLNYNKKKLYLSKKSKLIPKNYNKVMIIRDENNLLVELELKLKTGLILTGKFIIDTGFDGAIYLTKEVCDYLKLDTTKQKNEILVHNSGIGGPSSPFLINGESININGCKINNPLILCSTNTIGPLSSGNYFGIVGNAFLNNFNIYLDIKNNNMHIKQVKERKKIIDDCNIGFSLTDRRDICGGYLVSTLVKDSEAHLKGICLGDIITHVNNFSVISLKYKDISKILCVPNKTITLEIKRKEKTLQVQLDSK